MNEVIFYAVTRRKRTQIRLTAERRGEHHITVPEHDAVKIGTLAGILGDVAAHPGA